MRRRSMSAARRGIIALTLFAAACRSADAPKLVETIDSHAATARLLVAELGTQHVSRRYAIDLTHRLGQGLDQQATAAEQARLSSDDRRRVGDALARARRDVARAAAVAGAP